MRKVLFYLPLLFVVCCSVKNHISNEYVLESSKSKLGEIRTLSYDERIFLGNTASYDTTHFLHYDIAFGENNTIEKMSMRAVDSLYDSKKYYTGDSLYVLSMLDTTYYVSKAPSKSIISNIDLLRDINNWRFFLNPDIIKSRCRDTILNGDSCYSIISEKYDSAFGKKITYHFTNYVIDKKNLLPVYTKFIIHSLDNPHSKNVFSEIWYSNYKLNNLTKTDFIFDKSKYTRQNIGNHHLLADGDNAPSLFTLKDLQGNNIDSAGLKNKIILLEFRTGIIGSNYRSISILNRIYKKYNSDSVKILDVYFDAKKETVLQLRKKYNADFPGYFGNKLLINKYYAYGSPYYYLINKDNKIVKSSFGTNNNFESDFCSEIDNLLKK